MKYEYSNAKAKVLQKLHDLWQYASSSSIRKAWFEQDQKASRYRFGDQWQDPVMLKDMREIGAKPYTINKIDPTILLLTSLQINSRKRISIRPTSDLKTYLDTTEYLNNLFYTLQTQLGFAHKDTIKLQDAYTGGIGASYFGYDPTSYSPFFRDHVDRREVWWDIDDQTPYLNNPDYAIRSYFLSLTKAKERYPEHAEYFDFLVGSKKDSYSYSAGNEMEFHTLNNEEVGTWAVGRSIRIVEIYYKENSKFYETTVAFEPSEEEQNPDAMVLEQFYNTFNKAEAERKKTQGAEVKTRDGTKIMKGVFCADSLLEHGMLYPQVPNQKHFPLHIFCLQRNWQGMPYGIVHGLTDLSDMSNLIWTKVIHGLDAKLLMVSDNQLDVAKNGKAIATEMKKKVGVIGVPSVKDAQFINSENMMPFLFNSMQMLNVEFQQRTQLFDEVKGNASNADSGVAIEARTINNIRAQSPYSSLYENMILEQGQVMLDTIMGIEDLNYTFNYYKDGKPNKATISEEIASMNFEVFCDTAPAFVSSSEEEQIKFSNLLAQPNMQLVLANPKFLQVIGFDPSKAEELNKAYLETMQAMQGGGNPEQAPQQPNQQVNQ